MENQRNIFLGCPTHNGQIDYRMAQAFYVQASANYTIINAIVKSSLLAYGCNTLWCKALNLRKEYNLKWFAMLHADVVPEPFWLDKLISLAEYNDADLLSACIPIKDSEGITSTAISNSNKSEFGCMMRLTQTQVRKKLPVTFSISNILALGNTYPFDHVTPDCRLLVNTGCMVMRLDKPWSEELFFTINDRVSCKYDQFYNEVEPEDWFFSRKVAEHGGKVMATSEVKLQHIGINGYQSNAVWGHEIDPKFSPVTR